MQQRGNMRALVAYLEETVSLYFLYLYNLYVWVIPTSYIYIYYY